MLDGEAAEQGINIRRVTLAEVAPRKERPFDPQKDLTLADWQGMLDQFERSKGDWLNIPKLAFAISLIDKTQVSKMGWDEEMVDGIQYLLDDHRFEHVYTMYAELAAQLVHMGVQDKFDLSFLKDERVWRAVKDQYEKYNPSDFFTHNIDPYTVAQILFPDKVHELPPMNDTAFLSLLKRMTSHLEHVFRNDPYQRLDGLSDAFVQARFMRPDIDLTIAGANNEFWKDMRAHKPEPHYGFSLILTAAKMSVLAADDIRVSPNGIEVIYNRPKNHTSLPVVKAA